MDAPELGSTYRQGQTDYKVVGVSASEPFEYTATGESLELVVGDIPGTIVLVPAEGAVVKVDPSQASVWVNGSPHEPVTGNSYLQKHGKNVRWLLLELIR